MAPKFKGEKIRFNTPPQPKALLDREPYEIPGTLAWLENKPDYVSPESTQKTERHVSAAKIRRNQQEVEKIKQDIHTHGWEMIEGGEQHGQWINTGKYPNILFEPGQVKEIESGCSVLFPLSDGVEDPLGIAFHFHQCANGIYKVVTNEWYTIETHTRRGRRASKREMKRRKKQRQKRHHPENNHRPMYNKSRSAPESSPPSPTTSPRTTLPRTTSPRTTSVSRLSLEISE